MQLMGIELESLDLVFLHRSASRRDVFFPACPIQQLIQADDFKVSYYMHW